MKICTQVGEKKFYTLRSLQNTYIFIHCCSLLTKMFDKYWYPRCKHFLLELISENDFLSIKNLNAHLGYWSIILKYDCKHFNLTYQQIRMMKLLYMAIQLTATFFIIFYSLLNRLIKEGICDRTTAPSVSAISRLLRGREGETEKKILDGKEQLLWSFFSFFSYEDICVYSNFVFLEFVISSAMIIFRLLLLS